MTPPPPTWRQRQQQAKTIKQNEQTNAPATFFQEARDIPVFLQQEAHLSQVTLLLCMRAIRQTGRGPMPARSGPWSKSDLCVESVVIFVSAVRIYLYRMSSVLDIFFVRSFKTFFCWGTIILLPPHGRRSRDQHKSTRQQAHSTTHQPNELALSRHILHVASHGVLAGHPRYTRVLGGEAVSAAFVLPCRGRVCSCGDAAFFTETLSHSEPRLMLLRRPHLCSDRMVQTSGFRLLLL